MSYSGDMFSYDDVAIFPKPVDPIPIWYGGTTTISVRNAVNYCDAWMPGRIPLATLDDRLTTLAQLEEEAGDGRHVTRSIIPLVKVDKNRERARSGLPIEALAGSSEASKDWIAPEGGFQELDDLRGIVAAGTPSEIIDQVVEIAERGIDHFVFDLRMQHDEFEKTLELIGSEVLPELKKAKV
jgi:alkanesulfonate monooxygenase SsuD/methylene tetrahydromethanopterin reductase-like flavin-dependent oxidoreductase (luciferase family)